MLVTALAPKIGYDKAAEDRQDRARQRHDVARGGGPPRLSHRRGIRPAGAARAHDPAGLTQRSGRQRNFKPFAIQFTEPCLAQITAVCHSGSCVEYTHALPPYRRNWPIAATDSEAHHRAFGKGRALTWPRSSICGSPASAPPAATPNAAPPNSGSPMALPNRSAIKRRRTVTRPAKLSISIESNQETVDEVAGYQTLHRYRWAQDERQSRRCVLEGSEGNRRRPQCDPVRSCVHPSTPIASTAISRRRSGCSCSTIIATTPFRRASRR